MKTLISVVCCIMIFAGCMVYHEKIVYFFANAYSNSQKDPSILVNNDYAKNNSYKFVQLTNQFTPESRQDIMNIYYTIINSGMKEFIFYCPSSYKTCIDDVNYISNNQILLSNINNFIPVYNSFQNIKTEFDSLGKVMIRITHTYSSKNISEIEQKIEDIMKEIDTTKPTEEIIKQIHDYIINHTRYDVDRSDKKVNTYQSDNAYGALIEHYAICGGYADSMKLFLDLLEIPNYKISSENHIWNLVYINDSWVHLDLTWDDPVTSTGKDVLEYNYYLITTKELEDLKTNQHIFDKNIYLEAYE